MLKSSHSRRSEAVFDFEPLINLKNQFSIKYVNLNKNTKFVIWQLFVLLFTK